MLAFTVLELTSEAGVTFLMKRSLVLLVPRLCDTVQHGKY